MLTKLDRKEESFMTKLTDLAKDLTYAREAIEIYQKCCVRHSFQHQDMTLMKDLDSMKYWIDQLKTKERAIYDILIDKKLMKKPKEDKNVA